MGLRERGLEIKTRDQLERMRRAGCVVAETLALLRSRTRPGMSTGHLDTLAEAAIRERGAVPSFLGYHGFPASVCISVNEEVVHGIPGTRVLAPGDVVSIDCGAIVDGWHGDAAITLALGELAPECKAMLQVCEDALRLGIAAARPDGRVTDISAAIERHVRAEGDYGIVEDYVGHGIGSAMHQPPNVPNRGRPGRGPRLVPGLALAVEPMITLGDPATQVLADGWTVVTQDGAPAAHFEHTFAMTRDGPRVLTAPTIREFPSGHP